MDTVAINNAIKSRGIKKTYIASQLSLSKEAFRRKINGNIEFKGSELIKIKNILNLNNDEFVALFF